MTRLLTVLRHMLRRVTDIVADVSRPVRVRFEGKCPGSKEAELPVSIDMAEALQVLRGSQPRELCITALT